MSVVGALQTFGGLSLSLGLGEPGGPLRSCPPPEARAAGGGPRPHGAPRAWLAGPPRATPPPPGGVGVGGAPPA